MEWILIKTELEMSKDEIKAVFVFCSQPWLDSAFLSATKSFRGLFFVSLGLTFYMGISHLIYLCISSTRVQPHSQIKA